MRIAIPQSILDFRKWAGTKVPSRKHPAPSSFASIRRQFFYLTRKEVRQIEAAHSYALECHRHQTRKDGSPFIIHPMATSAILAEMRLDVTTIIASLLHDVIEDCDISSNDIKQRFGEKVAEIVEGVTKLEKLEGQTIADQQAENFQKMILAMASDLRVILVKIADRLHNMRTLGSMINTSKRRIARETLEIYAPIANRIGLDEIFRELQELAFASLYPLRYKVLRKRLDDELTKREANIIRVQNELTIRIKKMGIKSEISARQKTPFSVYNKMHTRVFADITDRIGIRIIVEKKEQCYQVLGIVHSMYKPDIARLKDFIALPKINGYQSLHTTVRNPAFGIIEVQIRSRAMDWVATSGLASHWLYKGKAEEIINIEKNTNQWISSIVDLKQQSSNAGELLENVKIDLFNQSVYVFTPDGKIITLPRGATALDFAYYIHSEIGHQAKYATINHEERSLETELFNGDNVEIHVSNSPTVSVASITIAKTARARSIIRSYLRTVQKQNLQDLGEHWLRQILLDIAIANNKPEIEKLIQELSLGEIEKMLVKENICGVGQLNKVFSDIALGNVSPLMIAQSIIKKEVGNLEVMQNETLIITSEKMPLVQMATCCFPVPDDEIIGILKKIDGVIVHRKDCRKIANIQHRSHGGVKDKNRQMQVEWDNEINGNFTSRLIVTVDNSRGVLADISRILADQNCNIIGIKMHTSTDMLTPVSFDIQVSNRLMLSHIIKKLRALSSVKSIARYRQE